MKIALVYPGIVCIGYNSNTTLGLDSAEALPIYAFALLSGVLRARGHDVCLIDLRHLANEDELIERLADPTLQAIGVTVQTPSFNVACHVAELAKAAGKITIAGGVHATVAASDFDRTCWDHVISGDGEVSLPQLLDDLDAGREAAKFITGQSLASLDELPLPEYFEEWVPKYREWYGIEVARGCVGRCTYCVSGQREYYPTTRARSNEHVMREIEDAYARFGFKHLAFLDVNATTNRKRFNQLLDMVYERFPQLQVGIQGRVDCLAEDTVERLARFDAGGLIWFGVETASPNMIQFINKRVNLEQLHRAFRICAEHKITTALMMIIGIPTETEEDLQLSLDFIKRTKPDMLAVNIMSPFPGTPLFQWCKDQGLLPQPLMHERFHIQRVFERGLISSVDYDLVRRWHRRMHETYKLFRLPGIDAIDEAVESFCDRTRAEGWRVGYWGASITMRRIHEATSLRRLGAIAVFEPDLRRWGEGFGELEILPPHYLRDAKLDAIVLAPGHSAAELEQHLSPQELERMVFLSLPEPGSAGPVTDPLVNLLRKPIEPEGRGWHRNNVVVNESDVSAPVTDGGTARFVTEIAGDDVHEITQDVGKPEEERIYTASIHLRAGQRRVALFVGNRLLTAGAYLTFDPATGQQFPVMGVGNDWEILDCGRKALADGWWRIWLVVRSDTSDAIRFCLRLADQENAQVFEGNGRSGVFVAAPQLQENAVPTPFVPGTPP